MDEVDIQVTPYKYQGIPLMPSAIQELILELYPGQTVRREVIVDGVRHAHVSRGGLDSNAADFPRSVKKALANLKSRGQAINPAKAIWRISGEPPQDIECEPAPVIQTESESPSNYDADHVFGAGRSAIYVYYFDTYEQKAIADGSMFWPCKIGRTDRDPLTRVLSQSSTALPEFPHFSILFYTDTPSVWEHAIHKILCLRGRTTVDAPGTEWFDTCPAEILTIIEFIDPSQVSKKESS